MLKHISDKNEYLEAIKNGRVLVDFYADWCGPCKMLAPIVEKVADEHPEVDVIKVNVDEAPSIAALYGVYSIPTLIYFENGELGRQQAGYMPEEMVKRFANI